MESKSDKLDKVLNTIEMNHHYKTIHSTSQSTQDQYYHTIDQFARFIRQVRRHEHSELYIDNSESESQGEDLISGISDLVIHLTNSFTKEDIRKLPVETGNLFWELADQLDVLIDDLEKERNLEKEYFNG